MTGKNGLPSVMIEPEDAISLLPHITLGEMERAYALSKIYEAYGSRFGFIGLLSFVYATARIQGIREERAKKWLSEHSHEESANGQEN